MIYYLVECCHLCTTWILHTGSWPKEQTLTRVNDLGWTPLVQVAHHGRDDIFDLAVKKKSRCQCKDSWGRTALSFAAEHGSEHKVRSLLNRKADHRFPRYRTPLTYAARNHHLQVVLLLLRHTEGVDFADESLRPAVTSAVAFSDVVFLELVIEKGKLNDSIRTVRRHFNAQQAWEFARRKVAA